MRGYIRVVTIPGKEAPTAAVCKAKTELLAKGLKVASGASEKKRILAALARFPTTEGLAIVQGCVSDAALSVEAKLAISQIKWAMARTTAKVSASRGADQAALAIDGQRKTIWSTGGVMKAGDSFTLILAKADTINGITIDCGDNMQDFPREYELFLSNDGKTWSTPVVKGKAVNGITKIPFTGKTASAIKIVQTKNISSRDRKNRKNWSIAEITVSFE